MPSASIADPSYRASASTKIRRIGVVGPGLIGLGIPQYEGGNLGSAEDFGLLQLVAARGGFARDHGEQFQPSPWLRSLAERGRGLPRGRGNSSEGCDR